MPVLTPEGLYQALLWVLAFLSAQFCLVVAAGAWLQVRRNRLNRFRIRNHARWEAALVAYLFQGEPASVFEPLGPKERRLFLPFLVRALGTIAGSDGQRVRGLHDELGLGRDLARRLRSRRATVRALAAIEVGSFRLAGHDAAVAALLKDPVPHVAHAAARSLSASGRIEHAGPVLDWVLDQEHFQRDRLLWILEGFGLAFLPWLEARLDAQPEPDPRELMIYALLAASLRNPRDTLGLEAMLASGPHEVQVAAIKALGALGEPSALAAVAPFAKAESWILRAQAAKAIGILGGPGGIPSLLELMGDPVFDVRRNAAYALAHMGAAGVEALAWVADDPSSDPFARDLALERLQWVGAGRAR